MRIMFGFSFLPRQVNVNPKSIHSTERSASNPHLDGGNLVTLDRVPSFTIRIKMQKYIKSSLIPGIWGLLVKSWERSTCLSRPLPLC